ELVNSEEWKRELEYCLSNLSAFEDYIHEACKETGLGVNFIKAYLAMESRGNANAISNKGATGLGGMMKLAAIESDLKVNHHIDERFDPKSIIGSARYMKKCIDRFGDVIAGLIAYNWGPTNVADNLDIILSSKDLIKDQRLPLESRWYVIQVLARMKIFSNADFYNLKVEQKPLFSKMIFDEHIIKKNTTFKQLAKVFKVNEEILRKVNPALRADIIPEGTVIKIPHSI
ncbi:MAG: transglycosylase SLT domain-containing protein, partial [Candidatus Nanoarchaeia archaeon]